MTELLEKLNVELTIRGFAHSTQLAYRRCVKEFLNYTQSSIQDLNTDHVKSFLIFLIRKRGLSSASTNVASAALKFFCDIVINKNFPPSTFPMQKKRRYLPSVFSPQEVEQLFAAAENIRYRAILMLGYGCGLRVSEVVKIKIKDIDSRRMYLFIRQSKGNKDRCILLPEKVLKVLRDYYRVYKPKEWLFPTPRKDSNTPHLSTWGVNMLNVNYDCRSATITTAGFRSC